MKKTLQHWQSSRLVATYYKLNHRLQRHFALGRFCELSKRKQHQLLHRLEKLKRQLIHWQSLGKSLVAGSALLASLNTIQGQVIPVGSEFLVNTYTTNSQQVPAVAMDSDGDFVITWQSLDQDGSGLGIFAQRYNAQGAKLSDEFRVNTYTVDGQRNPSIAMDSDGDFVITWESNLQDGSSMGVYAQRYNAIGEPQGEEFRVNTYTSRSQSLPSIAMDSDGDFVIAWQNAGLNGDADEIYAQRYNAAGVAQGEGFRVNAYTVSSLFLPSIAMDGDGDFVVSWTSSDQDGSYYGIFARHFNALGMPQGGEFKVNTYTENNQLAPFIAMDNDGDFLVSWVSYYQDGSLTGVYAQRYASTDALVGAEFRVNTVTLRDQTSPSIAMDDDGDFVITWISGEPNDSYFGIYAQCYHSSGEPLGGEIRVHSNTVHVKINPDVAMDNFGNLIITWDSKNQDGSNWGIYAQRFSISPTTSVLQDVIEAPVKLYPNPAKDKVYVDLEKNANVRVFDLNGKLILETELIHQSFTITSLVSGMYLVELSNEGATLHSKLIIE
ncbi:MAG: T9SS type A sorting domain-containing protein [Cytophagaceae bacterium]|jgi:hypothetical protein|nr:T9SS type A sorting domain-containing protein [Cytophagaceae bacterium]